MYYSKESLRKINEQLRKMAYIPARQNGKSMKSLEYLTERIEKLSRNSRDIAIVDTNYENRR